MTKTLSLTISGRAVPKKNHPVMVAGRNLILPSKAFRAYEKDALKQLMAWGNQFVPGFVWVRAEYWLPDKRWWPDLVGLMQGTGDILEKAGLIANDRNIVSWDGSKIVGIDKENPRTEIYITEGWVSGGEKWW